MGIGTIGISHVAIDCRDLEKSLAFYHDALGLELYAALGGATKLGAGGGTFVELFAVGEGAAEGRGSLKHFSIAVESIERAMAHLATRGVEARGPFTLNENDPGLPTRTIAFITGPDDEEIELVEPAGQ